MRTFSLDRPIVIRYSNTSSNTTNTVADTNSIIGKALVLEKSECPRFILATHQITDQNMYILFNSSKVFILDHNFKIICTGYRAQNNLYYFKLKLLLGIKSNQNQTDTSNNSLSLSSNVSTIIINTNHLTQ